MEQLAPVQLAQYFENAGSRAIVCLSMAGHLDSLMLFPEAFAVLLVTGDEARKARERGLNGPREIEMLIGQPVAGLSPAELRDLIVAADADR